MAAEVVPYETLVAWGAVADRLAEVAADLGRLSEQAGRLLMQLTGRFDAAGNRTAPESELGDLLGDEFWDQLFRDVERRRMSDAC